MVVRKVRNRVINANLTRSQAELKAAINKSLTAYMKNAASPANLANVNRATRNLIKVYVENVAAANVKPPGNGGNNPLALTNGAAVSNENGGNKNKPLALPAPGGANYQLIKQRINNAPNTNALNTILSNLSKAGFSNTQVNNAVAHINRKRENLAQKKIATIKANENAKAAAIKANENAKAAATAARAAQNAANAEAAAKAERNAREAANKAATNAAEANKAATNIAASAIASVLQKQAAANAKAAANKAAENAARAANAAKAAAAAASGRNKLRAAATAARGASLLKAAGANARRQKLLNEAKRQEAMNAAHANFNRRINAANTMNRLGAINRNIAGANLDNKATLRRKIAIQKKKIEGLGVKAERALARATRSNNVILSRNSLNAPNKAQIRETVQSLTTNYNEFLKQIRNAHNPAMIRVLREKIARNGRKTVGVKFTPEQRANLSSRINNKNGSLKGPGPSSNVPKNGGPNNNMNKLSLSQLNSIIRLTKARLNKGQGANGNKNRLVRATKLANALRPKKKGLFGHIGGAIGAVGGAAVGGVKAAGGAAKYVAAGTVHHATQAVKAAAPYVKVSARYNGQKKAPSKKIPNTKIGNNNRNRKAFNAGFGNEPWARQL